MEARGGLWKSNVNERAEWTVKRDLAAGREVEHRNVGGGDYDCWAAGKGRCNGATLKVLAPQEKCGHLSEISRVVSINTRQSTKCWGSRVMQGSVYPYWHRLPHRSFVVIVGIYGISPSAKIFLTSDSILGSINVSSINAGKAGPPPLESLQQVGK